MRQYLCRSRQQLRFKQRVVRLVRSVVAGWCGRLWLVGAFGCGWLVWSIVAGWCGRLWLVGVVGCGWLV